MRYLNCTFRIQLKSLNHKEPTGFSCSFRFHPREFIGEPSTNRSTEDRIVNRDYIYTTKGRWSEYELDDEATDGTTFPLLQIPSEMTNHQYMLIQSWDMEIFWKNAAWVTRHKGTSKLPLASSDGDGNILDTHVPHQPTIIPSPMPLKDLRNDGLVGQIIIPSSRPWLKAIRWPPWWHGAVCYATVVGLLWSKWWRINHDPTGLTIPTLRSFRFVVQLTCIQNVVDDSKKHEGDL